MKTIPSPFQDDSQKKAAIKVTERGDLTGELGINWKGFTVSTNTGSCLFATGRPKPNSQKFHAYKPSFIRKSQFLCTKLKPSSNSAKRKRSNEDEETKPKRASISVIPQNGVSYLNAQGLNVHNYSQNPSPYYRLDPENNQPVPMISIPPLRNSSEECGPPLKRPSPLRHSLPVIPQSAADQYRFHFNEAHQREIAAGSLSLPPLLLDEDDDIEMKNAEDNKLSYNYRKISVDSASSLWKRPFRGDNDQVMYTSNDDDDDTDESIQDVMEEEEMEAFNENEMTVVTSDEEDDREEWKEMFARFQYRHEEEKTKLKAIPNPSKLFISTLLN